MTGLRPVSTKEVAEAIGKSESQTRKDLEKLERAGRVKRVGERGGWLPAQPPLLDLYALAGLPRPSQGSPATKQSGTPEESQSDG
jgi:biotin operon repressor